MSRAEAHRLGMTERSFDLLVKTVSFAVGQAPGAATYTADETLSALTVVMKTPTGILAALSNRAGRLAVLGLTLQSGSAGQPVVVAPSGEVTDSSWNWVPDQPVFVGADARLTQVSNVSPLRPAGMAGSSSSVILNFLPPITLA